MKRLLLLSFLLISIGVVNAQDTKLSKKERKALAEKEQLEKTKALVDSKKYEFTGNFMFTQKGRRVSMLTPPNNLKINGDQVTSNLPFIGTKQMPGGKAGVMFEGDLEDYEMSIDEKKNKIKVHFKHKDGTETFRFELSIAADGYTNVITSSNRRNTITYTGNITPLKE